MKSSPWTTVAFLVILAAGFASGWITRRCSSARQLGQLGSLVVMEDVVRSHDAAAEAYFTKTPEIAAFALEYYVQVLHDVTERREKAFPSRSVPNATEIDLMVAHTRLARMYEQMGNTKLMKYNMELALEMNPKNTPRQLLDFVDRLDESRSRKQTRGKPGS